MKFSSPVQARTFLKSLGACDRLITHLLLVGEAAEELLTFLSSYPLDLDYDFIKIGVAIHDAGKIEFTSELDGPGSEHEPAGEQLLLKHGIDSKIARCCLSHARYDELECSLEELLIALSDKLWKGKRIEPLETRIIRLIAGKLGKDYWDIYLDFDSCFETIALGGDARLARSR